MALSTLNGTSIKVFLSDTMNLLILAVFFIVKKKYEKEIKIFVRALSAQLFYV